jgi:hypothetical protein
MRKGCWSDFGSTHHNAQKTAPHPKSGNENEIRGITLSWGS